MDFWLPIIIQVGVLLVTGAVALWKMSRAREKELQAIREKVASERKAMQDDLVAAKKEMNAKINTNAKEDADKRRIIYEKMEELERRADDTYVRQDNFKILHGALKEATSEIASDVKKLLLKGKGGE